MKEARRTHELYKEGKGIPDLKKIIDREFG
jgi:hypothetical protein